MVASYESFYTGGPSSWSPSYGVGNLIYSHVHPGTLASTTSPQTANQISEVISRIKEGVKHVELQPLAGDVFEQIPIQHWDEIRAIMKLTGVSPSVHAPVVNPAGFGQRGWEGESARASTERRFVEILDRAHRLNPDGNIPVVFHSTEGVQGATFTPGDVEKGQSRFKKVEEIAINRDTGEMTSLKEKRQFNILRPEDLNGDPVYNSDSGTLMTIESSLRSANQTVWEKNMVEIATLQKKIEEVLGSAPKVLIDYQDKPLDQKTLSSMTSQEYASFLKVQDSGVFLENMRLSLNSAFDKLYEYGTEDQRKDLKTLSQSLTKAHQDYIGVAKGDKVYRKVLDPVNELILYKNAVNKLSEITAGGQNSPQVFVPVEDFALEKTAKTFGNVAWQAYEKFGDTAPVVAIENMYQGMPFAQAEDMKKLILKSREIFKENALKKGLSEKEAEKQAEKLIGVTWDVGHLNIMKKSGFTDKDMISQSEKIAPYVKHIHLTDNFGYSDSHLAPGMGNVPIKEILEKLEKKGDRRGMKKVLEAGALVSPQNGLGMMPLPWALKAMGSPIYGAHGSSYWNQASGLTGGYFSGYGFTNPSLHHSMYSAGFTTLPVEFGGNIPGTQSRFSGTPNA